MDALDKVISINEATQLTGYTRGYLVFLCHIGAVEARKSGTIWLVFKPSLEQYCKDRTGVLYK